MKIICAYCGESSERKTGDFNKSKKAGWRLYCDQKCSGLGQRKNLTDEQKKKNKRLYDIEYRVKNRKTLKQNARVYFQKTYDPVAAAIVRKKRMPYHVKYCQRPEYKKRKKAYDSVYRAKKGYGEFWESHLGFLDINKEVLAQASRYEIMTAKGTLNKKLKRRRQDDKLNSSKLEGCPLGYTH